MSIIADIARPTDILTGPPVQGLTHKYRTVLRYVGSHAARHVDEPFLVVKRIIWQHADVAPPHVEVTRYADLEDAVFEWGRRRRLEIALARVEYIKVINDEMERSPSLHRVPGVVVEDTTRKPTA